MDKSFINYLIKNNKSKSTIKNYHIDIEYFISWFESENTESFTMHKITPVDIINYKKHLQESYSLATTNKRLTAIRQYLSYMWQKNKNYINFALPLLIKSEAPKLEFLDLKNIAELEQALDLYPNKQASAIMRIILHTGLKVSQLCDLKWSQVNMDKDNLYILISEGKEDPRIIPLTQAAYKSFLRLRYNDKAIGEDNYIFYTQRGRISPRGLQWICSKFSKEYGVRITPRILRSSFCKNLFVTTKNIGQAIKIAGFKERSISRFLDESQNSNLS